MRFTTAALVGAVLCVCGYQSALAQGMGSQADGLPALEQRVTELEAQIADLQGLVASLQSDGVPNLSTYVRVDESGPAPVVWFEAVNVKIVNGTGFTGSALGTPGLLNGLGNLIVGYDEERDPAQGLGVSDKTGSHNLIVGPDHNYSSYGGLVAGVINTVSGAHASASGGAGNTASGDGSSVSGGVANVASDFVSSVSGGELNTASGNSSSVSGGQGNEASGESAAVSGGDNNVASDEFATVSGGSNNTASALSSTVSGGSLNSIGSDHGHVP